MNYLLLVDSCGGADILRVIQFSVKILNIIYYLVPIVLIVMLSIDFVKSMIAFDDGESKKNFSLVFKRIINTFFLFLVPTIVNVVIGLLGDNKVYFAQCIQISGGDLSQYEIEFDEDYSNTVSNLSYSVPKAVVGKNNNQGVSNVVTKAADFVENIYKNGHHGYNMTDRYGEKWGDYTCSGLIIRAYEEAGISLRNNALKKHNISPDGFYTSTMISTFLESGFKDVTKSVNLATGKGLQRGDVLVYTGHHSALYIGKNKLIEATKDYDGKHGDSVGHKEIQKNNYSARFDKVLRYTGKK